MIIFYNSYSTTDGKKYLMGYEEGNLNTGNVIVEEIKDNKNEDEDDWLYQPDIIKQIKTGEREIKEGKKILWEYKSIIKNKLEKPVDLKKLYYEQFDEGGKI